MSQQLLEKKLRQIEDFNKQLNEYKTVTMQYGAGNYITYKVVNGTAYHMATPMAVVRELEFARLQSRRIRIFYGDAETGEDWCAEYNVIGTIGRSTGIIKVPLLLKKITSYGGGALLDHCIVKITENKRVIYQHKNYHIGELTIKDADKDAKEKGYILAVCKNGKLQVNFKTYKDAQNYITFLKGERNRC